MSRKRRKLFFTNVTITTWIRNTNLFKNSDRKTYRNNWAFRKRVENEECVKSFFISIIVNRPHAERHWWSLNVCCYCFFDDFRVFRYDCQFFLVRFSSFWYSFRFTHRIISRDFVWLYELNFFSLVGYVFIVRT